MVSSGELEGGGDGPRSIVGRYALYDQLASGGMATVHIGRLMGLAGFSRTVAVKRLHPHLASDQNFVAMLLDEARLVVRVRHPNVVPVIDVVQDKDELLLVMEYVQGEPLSVLLRLTADRGERMPLKMVRSVIAGILHGLHAAHESTDEKGEPLGIVHRDVSPQNIIVGVDGVARVLDFGIAKAAGRLQMTADGELKGKTPYMSPEQLRGEPVDRRTDVYAAAVLLWEMLTTRGLFRGQTQPEIAYKVLEGLVGVPSDVAPDVPPELDAIVMRGLARDPNDRFATALEMAIAVEELGELATARAIGEWVEAKGSDRLRERAAIIAAIESSSFQRASLSRLAVAAATRPRANPDLPTTVEGARVSTDPSARSAAPQRASRRVSLAAVALLTAVVVLALVGWFLWRSGPPAPSLAGGTPSGTPSAPTTGATTTTVPPNLPSSSPSTAATLPGPSATVAGSASAAADGGAGRTRTPVGPRGPHPQTTAKPAQPTCDPPYTLDSRGIRVPKPECL